VIGGATREVLGGGVALPVDVRALSAELRRLWESAEEGTAVTRACARNLIAFCAGGAADATKETLVEVATEHAARAFLVVASAGPSDRLEATLEAHCIVRPGRRHVCCEQVSLAVGDGARLRAASAILPLLVPDLPVFAWVAGALDFADPALVRVLEATDRLVFDSRACPDPARMLVEVAHAERGDRWAPADLEWARLEPWRDAVAALFDEPKSASLAAHVTRIEVEHGPDARVAGALLAGWLADRAAAARDEEKPGERARVEAGDGAGEASEPDVVLVPATAAGVRRATLVTRHPDARLEARLAEEGHALVLSVAASDLCALPMRRPLAEAPLAELVGRLVSTAAPDALYETALLRAATWLGGLPPAERA